VYVRTRAKSKKIEKVDTHYKINVTFDTETIRQVCVYILAWKSAFKGDCFPEKNPPKEFDPRAYLNSGDELKNHLQAAVVKA
jgi:hypothetical protein